MPGAAESNLPLFARVAQYSISGDIGPDYSVYATTNVAKLFRTGLAAHNPAVLPFNSLIYSDELRPAILQSFAWPMNPYAKRAERNAGTARVNHSFTKL